MQQSWLKTLPHHCFFLPTTSINDATHPPPPLSACHNTMTTMRAARSCPAQVSKQNTPPSLIIDTKGAMSQLVTWQPDDDVTTVTCTTWHHNTTTMATPPCVYASLNSDDDSPHPPMAPHHHTVPLPTNKDRLPTNEDGAPPNEDDRHERRLLPTPTNKDDHPRTKTTVCEWKQLPMNKVNHLWTKMTTHKHECTWAMTHRHRQQWVDMGNDKWTWATTSPGELPLSITLHHSLPSIAPPPSITPHHCLPSTTLNGQVFPCDA